MDSESLWTFVDVAVIHAAVIRRHNYDYTYRKLQHFHLDATPLPPFICLPWRWRLNNFLVCICRFGNGVLEHKCFFLKARALLRIVSVHCDSFSYRRNSGWWLLLLVLYLSSDQLGRVKLSAEILMRTIFAEMGLDSFSLAGQFYNQLQNYYKFHYRWCLKLGVTAQCSVPGLSLCCHFLLPPCLHRQSIVPSHLMVPSRLSSRIRIHLCRVKHQPMFVAFPLVFQIITLKHTFLFPPVIVTLTKRLVYVILCFQLQELDNCTCSLGEFYLFFARPFGCRHRLSSPYNINFVDYDINVPAFFSLGVQPIES